MNEIRIRMAGIDHKTAPVEIREKFSLTATALEEALAKSRTIEEVTGCVIISTCNRTECWMSYREADFPEKNREPAADRAENIEAGNAKAGNAAAGKTERSPAEFLCRLKAADPGAAAPYLTEREGRDAVHYLMELACGLQSQIFGDNQIITQVRSASERARQAGALGNVLDNLFRTAITGAKKVKTKVLLTNVDRSTAGAMIELLIREQIPVRNRKCMVIGNGEIGRLAAAELYKAGGDVVMTLRQYKTKEVIIPAGCRVIEYENRYEYAKQAELIVSATLSPHYTITREGFSGTIAGEEDKERVFIDLAIPRDIEPEIGTIPGVRLFDMDSFHSIKEAGDEKQIRRADEILKKYEEEFLTWYEMRDCVPLVKKIARLSGKNTAVRMKKDWKTHGICKEEREDLERAVERAAEKAVTKLCYGMKEGKTKEAFMELLAAMEQSAEDL